MKQQVVGAFLWPSPVADGILALRGVGETDGLYTWETVLEVSVYLRIRPPASPSSHFKHYSDSQI